MKVYCLSKKGKIFTKGEHGGGDEMKILDYLRENKTATEDELPVVGDEYLVRRLVRQGLIDDFTKEVK